MSEVATERVEDITDEVVAFLTEARDPGVVQAAKIPGLEVVVTEGEMQASQLVVDTDDGCHPQEYEVTKTGKRFPVRSLFSTGTGHSSWAHIQTMAGPIASAQEQLDAYRFVRPEPELREPSQQEQALRERLEAVRFLANAPVSQLVGYRHELLVSSRDQLEYPISVPSSSQYGSVEPLHEMSPVRLSVWDAGQRLVAMAFDARGRQGRTELAVDRSKGEGVPLDELDFQIRPYKNQVAAVLHQAVEVSEAGDIPPFDVVREFNSLPNLEDYRMYPRTVTPTHGGYGFATNAMIGEVERGTVNHLRLAYLDDFHPYRIDKLIVDPHSHQLFAVDAEQGVAIDAASIAIATPRDAADRARTDRFR